MGELDLTVAEGVAVITVDRPHARNALALSTMAALAEAVERARAPDVRVVVVTGAGERAFIAGGDLKELEGIRDGERAAAMASGMRSTLDALATLPVPVIAALNGDAYGGGAEVAVAADFRIASDQARIGFTQVLLALVPAWGCVERLTAMVGRPRATYLLTTGRVLTMPEAERWGLVEEVVPAALFEERWRELAARLARTPAHVMRGIKAGILAADPPARPDLAPAGLEHFTRAWVDDAHWQAAALMERQRRERRRG